MEIFNPTTMKLSYARKNGLLSRKIAIPPVISDLLVPDQLSNIAIPYWVRRVRVWSSWQNASF